jgi:hypothetical protein
MYRALLVAPDGDFVTDYTCETVNEVEEMLANQGSRWYFYPFHAVISWNPRPVGTWMENYRLISCAWPFEDYKGKAVKTFCKMIAETPERELEAILS